LGRRASPNEKSPWSVPNINIMRSSFVDGLGYPLAAQQYGARWFFNN
jgi:hypothetical protein